MRSFSTPQSSLNLEITKLAIIESATAVALYVCIGLYFGTFRYLAVAVVVAPLMLFRTEASADWGFRFYERCIYALDRRITDPLWSFPVIHMVAPVIGSALRIIATSYWAVRRPLQTLKEAPRNWLRQCFCTDFFHPPEIVPLEATKADSDRIPIFTNLFETFREEKDIRWKLVLIIILVPIIVVGWLPSMIYRVSFKATAIVYAPFIWVAHATLQNSLPLKVRLERITKGELEKVRRGLSWVILTTLAAKLALVFSWVDRSYIDSMIPSQKFVQSIVFPDSWPWWQITLGLDALLTFFLLYFADAALARLGSQQNWREDVILKTTSAVSFLRATLSIVTMSHFFYIALIKVAPRSISHLLGAA